MGHLTYINTVPKGKNVTNKSSPTDPPKGITPSGYSIGPAWQ
jgi:hypothetical protein